MLLEVLLFLAVLVFFVLMRNKRPPNMPPGPNGLPYFGTMPVLNEKTAMKLKSQYGDIISYHTGSHWSVMIFDYKTAKEVYSRPEVSGRPHIFQFFNLDDQKTGGVAFSEGKQWQHDRRFFLRNLRNFGMGKTSLETAVHFEAEALIEDLKKYDQQPIKFPDSFRTAPLNVIWAMIASKRYDLRSKEVLKMYQASKDFYQNGWYASVLPYFPILNWIPNFITRLFYKPEVVAQYLKNMAAIVDEAITEHEKDFNPDSPRDLIDEYLLDLTNEKNEFLRKGALRQIVADAFDAGSDTIQFMLRWVSFLLAGYPQVAEKLRKEMDQVVPRDRMISINDKPNLPYMEAFITEAFRYSSMVSVVFDHRVMSNTKILGYDIPKNTSVQACAYSMHRDTKYWNDPDTFLPERFIDEAGKFKQPTEGFFLFSNGLRQCPGEPLARMEVFLFAAAMVQNLDVQVPEGEQFVDEVFSTEFGLRTPYDQKLVYKPRL